MKDLLVSLALALTLLPSAAVSQNIPIRAGEHDDFTRLVVRIPPGSQWEIETALGRVAVKFEGYDSGFNSDRVFQRIPKSRVINITTAGDGFVVETRCQCEVAAFVAEESFLAIDFLNGPEILDQSDTAQSSTNFVSGTFEFGALLWSSEENSPASAYNDYNSAPDEVGESEYFFREVRDSLVSSISEAAVRGIVTAQEAFELNESAPTIQPIDEASIFDSSAITEVNQQSIVSNLRVTSSQDLPTYTLNHYQSLDTLDCNDTQDLDVRTWGGQFARFSDIGAFRSKLYNEADQFDHENGILLTKFYIYYGFGAEANQVLNFSDQLKIDYPELSDMADIMEFGYARNPRTLHTGLACPTEIALWSVLSAKSIPPSQYLNTDSVLRALNGLPLHLRTILAPKVSERLAKFGELDVAEAAMRTINRSSFRMEDDAKVAQAEISMRIGNSQEAVNTLEKVAKSGSELSPSALITLIDEKVDNGSSVSPELALLSEAYAHEFEASELGDELVKAEIIAAAKSGQFHKSFDLLDKHKTRQSVIAELSSLKSILLKELNKNSSDIDFLIKIFSMLPTFLEGTDSDEVLFAAKRTLDLGFVNRARSILSSNLSLADSREGRLLAAKLELDSSNHFAALEAILDVNGVDANLVRASAKEMLGQNSEAQQLFIMAGDSAAAFRNAWLSPDINPSLLKPGSGLEQLAASAVADLPFINPGRGMLADVQHLIDLNETSRSVLSTVLKRK